MPNNVPHPTPHADVNAMIQEVFSGAQSMLGDDMLGMYLTGSLAAGDFDPHNSDIDFIVATRDELSSETMAALTAMHARIASGSSTWAVELEGSYIPQHALRRYDPANAWHPHIYRGRGEGESILTMMQHERDWVIHRHVLREHGVVIAGPPPRTLVDPVHPEDLRQAVVESASRWAGSFLRDSEPLRFDGYHAYTVVTLCRMLYTLHHGTVVSKPVAAQWAQATEGAPWAVLIERALDWAMCWEYVNETLDFIQYTLRRSEEYALPEDQR